jgi:hypothetical protein
MSYSDFLENPAEGVETLPAISKDEREDLTEELHAIQAVESI